MFLSVQFTEYFNDFASCYDDTYCFVIDSLNRLQLMAPKQTGNILVWHPSSALIQGQRELDIIMYFNPSRTPSVITPIFTCY
ncbi:MAG: hypothetical protein VX344_03490 [Bacteroidota bacterium]|nr:hypothetical protein [Bacteroidota bacterium]